LVLSHSFSSRLMLPISVMPDHAAIEAARNPTPSGTITMPAMPFLRFAGGGGGPHIGPRCQPGCAGSTAGGVCGACDEGVPCGGAVSSAWAKAVARQKVSVVAQAVTVFMRDGYHGNMRE